MTLRVLVVEDEPDIAGVLADYLRAAGYEPQVFGNGDEALEAALRDPPALLLLDLMLPGRDGLSVLRELRSGGHATPVILVTARVEEVDRLLGLELGADDYVCKPFSPREVVSRVRAVLRRTLADAPGPAAGSGLVLDAQGWRATLDRTPLELTPKEFKLLQALAVRPGRIFSRAQLLEIAHADAPDASERAVDSHVKNLRRKLAAVDASHEWIRSVYGVGFCFEPR